MPPPDDPSAIADLHAKYAEMRELRRLDASGATTDPRPRMVALAARFPGALREIDVLPAEEIERRLAALAAATEDAAQVAPWMRAMVRFHALLAGALAAKRWLAGRKDVDAATRAAFAERFRGSAATLAWEDALGALARPPGGRLLGLVLERVAEETRSSPEAVRDAIFGAPRERPTRRR
jgi:hypothetical protein